MKKVQSTKPGIDQKRAYHQPVLSDYGEVRTMTLDASQAAGIQYNVEKGEYVYEEPRGGRSVD